MYIHNHDGSDHVHDEHGNAVPLQPWLNPDRTLRIVDWATSTASGDLHVAEGDGPIQMVGTEATAWALVTGHGLGVDHISVPAGRGFAPHTHPGDHLLIIIKGDGTITTHGRIYPTHEGQVYFVPGNDTHAVGAITEHHILAVGSPHRLPDDPERMTLTEYAAIYGSLGELECGICGAKASGDNVPGMCPHAPTQ
jgi:quercetin dioxygenase-like cupin family protein